MKFIKNILKLYINTYSVWVIGNHNLSEEITAETFLVAIEKIDTFKGKCKISVWLCQIAKFLFYREIKRKNKTNYDDLNNLEDSSNLEESLIEKDEKIRLFKGILKLDEKTKDVVYLRLVGNLSFEEIAEITGKTANWARVTYFRGKEKLKEDFNNEKGNRM